MLSVIHKLWCQGWYELCIFEFGQSCQIYTIHKLYKPPVLSVRACIFINNSSWTCFQKWACIHSEFGAMYCCGCLLLAACIGGNKRKFALLTFWAELCKSKLLLIYVILIYVILTSDNSEINVRIQGYDLCISYTKAYRGMYRIWEFLQSNNWYLQVLVLLGTKLNPTIKSAGAWWEKKKGSFDSDALVFVNFLSPPS